MAKSLDGVTPYNPERMAYQPLHASQIDAALYMCGIIKDFSKGEALGRGYPMLEAQVKAGKVRKLRRGVYQIVPLD